MTLKNCWLVVGLQCKSLPGCSVVSRKTLMDALQISFLLDAAGRTRLQQNSCENKLSCPEPVDGGGVCVRWQILCLLYVRLSCQPRFMSPGAAVKILHSCCDPAQCCSVHSRDPPHKGQPLLSNHCYFTKLKTGISRAKGGSDLRFPQISAVPAVCLLQDGG